MYQKLFVGRNATNNNFDLKGRQAYACKGLLTLKTPYRDGTTHIVLSPLEFMQRLAALVPRPRLNLIRFHGVLAPNAKLRAEIIPDGQKNKSKPSDVNDDALQSPTSVRISWARLLKRVFDIDIEHCPHCGGTLKIIAAILESGAIAKILDHLSLPTRAPPRSPAKTHDLFLPKTGNAVQRSCAPAGHGKRFRIGLESA